MGRMRGNPRNELIDTGNSLAVASRDGAWGPGEQGERDQKVQVGSPKNGHGDAKDSMGTVITMCGVRRGLDSRG